MKTYIGTKIIQAEPEKRGEETGFKVRYPDGYVSWSPTQPFEEAYRGNGQLNFGHALHMLKRGHRIARSGWNGKGMFVYLVGPAHYPVQTEAAKAYFGEGSLVPYNAYMAIKNVNETVSTWVPSVNDVLAEDWMVLEEDA